MKYNASNFFNNEINITNELSYYTTESSGATTSTFGSLGNSYNKFSGGILVGNTIYCMPRNLGVIGKVDTTNDSYTSLGTVNSAPNKYNTGCYVPKNGKIYVGPQIDCRNILVINTTDDTFYTINNVIPTPTAGVDWYTHSIYDGGDYVYFTPCGARKVLRLNIITEQVSEIGTDYGTGTLKWIWACLSPDKKSIYCSPGYRRTILKINLETLTTSEINGAFGSGPTSIYSSGVLAKNGKIYFIPRINNIDAIALNPVDDSYVKFLGLTSTEDKYLGGVLSPNGKIYCIPFYSTRVLEINPVTNSGQFIGSTYTGNGKWYGGILAPNGSIYGIPFSSSTFLKITPTSIDKTFTKKMLESKWLNKS